MNVLVGRFFRNSICLKSLNNLSDHIHYFPEQSRSMLLEVSDHYSFRLIMKNARQSKLGDFRVPVKGEIPQITLNKDENKFRSLITYLHELAHLIVYLDYGRSRHPHGANWKRRFSQLLDIFSTEDIFPEPLFSAVQTHKLKPKASSHSDIQLLTALRHFDQNNADVVLHELEENTLFKLKNGKVFRKGKKRRSRVLCRELNSNRDYLIHCYAEVIPIE